MWVALKGLESKIGFMLTIQRENYLAKLLGFGAAFVSILVIASTVTDPVNLTKLLALGGVAGSALAVCSSSALSLMKRFKYVFVALGLFLIASINAILNSDAPLTQNLYGAYGRNTGFIAYLFFIVIFACALALRNRKSFDYLIWGLISAGIINNVYCIWVLIFGDFLAWNNPYGNILGTFGNPNFIGAFLGFYAASLAAYAATPGVNIKYRVLTFLAFGLTCYEILESNAIQGRVVIAGGLAIVCFYLIRSKFKSNLVLAFYSISVSLAGVVALLGALQIGPLTKYIYKYSVTLRGEYWQAGWNMGQSHPFTGVGFDSYGDWYRRSRDINALIVPGPNTVTNAAHNVPIDVLAYGGWPLFGAYVAILIFSIVAIVRFSIRNRGYDGRFVALTVAWVCYQIQSLISINQIGLAVWGWILGGALIAYERVNREVEKNTQPSVKNINQVRKSQTLNYFSPQLLAGVGAVVGLIISCPPYSADSKFYSAMKSSDVTKIESALITSYLTPVNSYKLAYAADIFESSQLFDLAHTYARKAVEFNPNHFDSWRILYAAKNTPATEKATAWENMRRLDPNNKEFMVSK